MKQDQFAISGFTIESLTLIGDAALKQATRQIFGSDTPAEETTELLQALTVLLSELARARAERAKIEAEQQRQRLNAIFSNVDEANGTEARFLFDELDSLTRWFADEIEDGAEQVKPEKPVDALDTLTVDELRVLYKEMSEHQTEYQLKPLGTEYPLNLAVYKIWRKLYQHYSAPLSHEEVQELARAIVKRNQSKFLKAEPFSHELGEIRRKLLKAIETPEVKQEKPFNWDQFNYIPFPSYRNRYQKYFSA